tara:strand:+ start:179 stop:385 length:207 start_codon:yes stop_codon:yes gene_type:complete
MISFGHQSKKQYIKHWGNNMFKLLLAKAIKKHGLIGILIKVGDVAVKVTKTKKDDVAWEKIKKVIKGL